MGPDSLKACKTPLLPARQATRTRTRWQRDTGRTYAADSATIGYASPSRHRRLGRTFSRQERIEEFLDLLLRRDRRADVDDAELLNQSDRGEADCARQGGDFVLSAHRQARRIPVPRSCSSSSTVIRAKPGDIVCLLGPTRIRRRGDRRRKTMEFVPATLEGHKVEQLVQYPSTSSLMRCCRSSRSRFRGEEVVAEFAQSLSSRESSRRVDGIHRLKLLVARSIERCRTVKPQANHPARPESSLRGKGWSEPVDPFEFAAEGRPNGPAAEIEILSPLEPADVIANLRDRGRMA